VNYLHPQRLDRLAREYVLGTLTGGARRRFERLLQHTPAAMLAVSAWQERFSVLAAAVPPLLPREAVWQGLERRLFTSPAEKEASSARGPLYWLRTILSGRALAGALAGVLVATAGCATSRRDRTRGAVRGAAGLCRALLDSRRSPTRAGRTALTVKVRQPASPRGGRLLALPARGQPFPVAPLPPLPARGSVTLPLPDTSEKLFSNVPRLAVTFESTPANPGEQMRGDPVLTGHCVKLW
jgi:anti-sigma-K factor RskA